MFLVQKGVEHKPVAIKDYQVQLIEPMDVINIGE